MIKLVMTAAIATVLSTAAFAHDEGETPGLDHRQEHQAERIEQGKESGALTEREANRMERQQERTEKLEEKAKSDGVVTKKERAHLQHRANKTSRHIAKQKHDGQHGHH